jgi:serine protease Do
MPNMVRRSLVLLIGLAVVVAAVVLSTRSLPASRAVQQPRLEPSLLAQETPRETTMDTALFRDIARRQNPVVVSIVTQARVEVIPENDEFFRWFFGIPPDQPESRLQRGVGSGFLIGNGGEILTNNHVVAGADVIKVGLFGDTKSYVATTVGRDPITDSALIRLEHPPLGLRSATFGDSDALEPGDWVMAIGNPFQLGHTVTVGVVSYQGRPFQLEEGRWQKMIQTDASINPGNSGGPLINARGEVVGINAAILGAGAAGNIGIGFAVPINSVRALLPQLRQGQVVRGRIGVQLRGGPITEDEAKALKLPKASGAIVVAVERDSAASRAGVQAGDVIAEFNGAVVASADDLIPRVSSTPPGTTTVIKVVRNGQVRALKVTVEALSLAEERPAAAAPERAGLGLTLDDITAAMGRHMRLPTGLDGALVTEVTGGSPADDAGVHAGDVVREINRRVVHNAADANRALAGIERGSAVFLLVWRQGNELFLQIRPE